MLVTPFYNLRPPFYNLRLTFYNLRHDDFTIFGNFFFFRSYDLTIVQYRAVQGDSACYNSFFCLKKGARKVGADRIGGGWWRRVCRILDLHLSF